MSFYFIPPFRFAVYFPFRSLCIMFFSPELLAKRDNGFGLLWLAATLGSKSAFKKLPRRSVMTADIAQLCDLIAEPAEPLALRLSSNLMVGVARVYKVKQEILFTDVTNCVASLKKVVLELQSAAKGGGDLQMPQPTIRASAVTLNVDPTAYDFDAFVADWDAFLNINDRARPEENSEVYDPDDVDGSKKPDPTRRKNPTLLLRMCALRSRVH
ncbi:Rec8 like protein-domain-containing protein [Mucidula mucida]|nr:Rec8 like protein-domain-containing protein [Mucidula mucida]